MNDLVLVFLQHGTAKVYGPFEDLPSVCQFAAETFGNWTADKIFENKKIDHSLGAYSLLVTRMETS